MSNLLKPKRARRAYPVVHPDGMITVPNTPVWSDGKYVVIRGPVPDGFVRSLSRKALSEAIRLDPDNLEIGLAARGPIDEDYKGYIKTLAIYVQDKQNEWGEIAP